MGLALGNKNQSQILGRAGRQNCHMSYNLPSHYRMECSEAMAEYDLHWRLSVLQGNDWFRDLPLPAQQALARISRHRRYLNGELIARIHAHQQQRGTPLNEVMAELLESGLSQLKK